MSWRPSPRASVQTTSLEKAALVPFTRVTLMRMSVLALNLSQLRSRFSTKKVFRATGNGLYVVLLLLKISFPLRSQSLIVDVSFLLFSQTEVNFLGQLRHPNLVKLIGYCCEDDHRLLVYEFMFRGSLENHLFRSMLFPPLPLFLCVLFFSHWNMFNCILLNYESPR